VIVKVVSFDRLGGWVSILFIMLPLMNIVTLVLVSIPHNITDPLKFLLPVKY